MTISRAMGTFMAEDSFNLIGTQLFRVYDMKDEQKSSTKSLTNTGQKRILLLLLIIIYYLLFLVSENLE